MEISTATEVPRASHQKCAENTDRLVGPDRQQRVRAGIGSGLRGGGISWWAEKE
jgi:hypothetical protein